MNQLVKRILLGAGVVILLLILVVSGYAIKTKSELNIDPERIAAIFLTHTDYDHVGGIRLFQNADLYFSRMEEKLLTGLYNRWKPLRQFPG